MRAGVLAVGQAKELEQKESELAGVSKALADQGVSSPSIWACCTGACSAMWSSARQEELARWLEEHRARVSTAERLPGAIASFLADFESLDVRRQRAQLQAFIRSAYVYRDGRLESELRG